MSVDEDESAERFADVLARLEWLEIVPKPRKLRTLEPAPFNGPAVEMVMQATHSDSALESLRFAAEWALAVADKYHARLTPEQRFDVKVWQRVSGLTRKIIECRHEVTSKPRRSTYA